VGDSNWILRVVAILDENPLADVISWDRSDRHTLVPYSPWESLAKIVSLMLRFRMTLNILQ